MIVKRNNGLTIGERRIQLLATICGTMQVLK
jgi:hypothetical protein